MNSFFDLVRFEYKKIFRRKSAIIAMILVVAAVCISPLMVFFGMTYINGEPFESLYHATLKDRAYARALAGRAVDEHLLTETKDAYSKIPASEVRYSATAEYQQYARPYSSIYWIIFAVYSTDYNGLRDVTEDDIRNFYRFRHEKAAEDIHDEMISDAAKEVLINLDAMIDTPFTFSYIEGFDTLIGGIYTLGIACAFALAICLAPMFSGEYATGADQLILSSKHGKNKMVSAKLFTTLTLFAALFILLISIAVVICMAIYGYDDANAPLQLLIPLSVYPLTLLEVVLVYSANTFLGIFLIVVITLLLSSRLKSPFSVIIIVSVLLFVPMMIQVPETIVWLFNLFSLLPSNLMTLWTVFSYVPYDFFGFIVLPYVFLPVFAFLAGSAMLPFARQAFKNHQVC